MQDKNNLVFNGREFRVMKESTSEHDFLMMNLVRGMGLDTFEMKEGEKAEDYAMRLLETVIRSGKAFDLLAGFIVPVECSDTNWTQEIANQTANVLRKVTDPTEKSVINQQMVGLLISFFNTGLMVLKTSPNYSVSPSDQPSSTETGDITTTETGI